MHGRALSPMVRGVAFRQAEVKAATGVQGGERLPVAPPNPCHLLKKGEGRRVLDEVNVRGPSRADRGGSRDDENFHWLAVTLCRFPPKPASTKFPIYPQIYLAILSKVCNDIRERGVALWQKPQARLRPGLKSSPRQRKAGLCTTGPTPCMPPISWRSSFLSTLAISASRAARTIWSSGPTVPPFLPLSWLFWPRCWGPWQTIRGTR